MKIAPMFLVACCACAHDLSMSSGDLTIDGPHARYELRMPLYEVAHVATPEDVLLDSVRFTGARRTTKDCRSDAAQQMFVCVAQYEFAKPVDEVEVECRLFAVTVPNHVHLLHAQSSGVREEAVFDRTATRTRIRFRPKGAADAAVSEVVAGFLRAFGSVAQWFFMAALVFAARSRRELISMTAAWLAGECAGMAASVIGGWSPAPLFVDAAVALTIAYLAVEMTLLPASGSRWIASAVLGAIQGGFFVLLLRESAYRTAMVATGAVIGGLVGVFSFAWLMERLGSARKKIARYGGWVLLAAGLGLFVVAMIR